MAVVRTRRILYNRIQKNANSTLSVMFHFLETGAARSPRRARQALPNLANIPATEIPEVEAFRRMVVIRDPFSRVLSAFLNKFDRDRIRSEYGEFDLSQQGFARFVSWLSDGGLAANGHWDLQGKQIILPLSDYSDIIRFEELGPALDALLRNIGIDPAVLEREGILELGRSNQTGASEKLQRFYDAPTAEAVRRLFAPDFEILGYDPDRFPGRN